MPSEGVYSVRNWDDIFENAKSRTIKDLGWLPIPNNHDGEGFSLVMLHKKAPEIFTAWILILQVASKCSNRGILVREDGRPHTAESIAVKTRGNPEWFRVALEFLTSEEVGWINFEPKNTTSTLDVHREDTKCPPSSLERKKGIEGNGTEFLADVKREYPKRAGDLCWKKAEGKIMGIPIQEREDVLIGVVAYRKFVEANGNVGTGYVKQATTFFNNDSWKEDWTIPTIGNGKLSGVALAAQVFE